MADLISQPFWIAAGNFKDFDDLLIRVMRRLSGTRAVIQERGNCLCQFGWIFFRNFLEKRKFLDETASPLADRILSKSYLL